MRKKRVGMVRCREVNPDLTREDRNRYCGKKYGHKGFHKDNFNCVWFTREEDRNMKVTEQHLAMWFNLDPKIDAKADRILSESDFSQGEQPNQSVVTCPNGQVFLATFTEITPQKSPEETRN